MPRREIRYCPGGYYHIYNRGANRTSIFLDTEDYLYVLRAMKEKAGQYDLQLIAYCLMRNHYHWLLRQERVVPAGLLPQRVFNGYVKAFNARHGRTGTLFESPYKVVAVEDDAYLRRLCLYIHANPVKDGFVTSPEAWAYSNYAEWIGLRSGSLYAPDFVAEFFGGAAGYRARMLEYLQNDIYVDGG